MSTQSLAIDHCPHRKNPMNNLINGVKSAFNPKTVVSELATLNLKELLFLATWLIIQTVAFIATGDFSVMGWVGVATGLLTAISLILVNHGLITNYTFGFFSTAAWLVVAFHTRLIGDISSQVFYLIMQFIGIAIWYKQMQLTNDGHVHARKLTPIKVVGIIVLTLVIYAINVKVAQHFNGTQIFLDATLLPLGIVGQILMTYGFLGQWFFWVSINLVNVVIWTNNFLGATSASKGAIVSMLILNIFMLINSFYGTYCWVRDAKEKVETK